MLLLLLKQSFWRYLRIVVTFLNTWFFTMILLVVVCIMSAFVIRAEDMINDVTCPKAACYIPPEPSFFRDYFSMRVLCGIALLQVFLVHVVQTLEMNAFLRTFKTVVPDNPATSMKSIPQKEVEQVPTRRWKENEGVYEVLL